MSSMGPDLEMGSLRDEMVKRPWVCRVVAVDRSRAAGCGSSGDVTGFIFACALYGQTDYSDSVAMPRLHELSGPNA